MNLYEVLTDHAEEKQQKQDKLVKKRVLWASLVCDGVEDEAEEKVDTTGEEVEESECDFTDEDDEIIEVEDEGEIVDDYVYGPPEVTIETVNPLLVSTGASESVSSDDTVFTDSECIVDLPNSDVLPLPSAPTRKANLTWVRHAFAVCFLGFWLRLLYNGYEFQLTLSKKYHEGYETLQLQLADVTAQVPATALHMELLLGAVHDIAGDLDELRHAIHRQKRLMDLMAERMADRMMQISQFRACYVDGNLTTPNVRLFCDPDGESLSRKSRYSWLL